MEYFELVRTAFLVVGFVLAMSRDRITWMTVDLIASVVMGLVWVIVPQVLLDFEVKCHCIVDPRGVDHAYNWHILVKDGVTSN